MFCSELDRRPYLHMADAVIVDYGHYWSHQQVNGDGDNELLFHMDDVDITYHSHY